MRYLGLVIEESHHTRSDNKRSFTSWELLDDLVDKIIPHEKIIIFPTEAPITAPNITHLAKGGNNIMDGIR